MKESILKFNKTLKKLFSFKKMDPHIYWNNLLNIFFIAMIGLVVFSFYLLYKIKNQQIFQIIALPTESPILINEKLLDKVVESFDNKLLKQDEIKEGQVIYKDPSIN
jgi:hypothetical protein